MLALSLMGQPLITLDGDPVTGFVSQKASALLAYLAVESDQPHGRPALAHIFWPDQTEAVARKNLRDILFNLQKLLRNRDANPPYLIITRHTIQFNNDSAHSLDSKAFTDWMTASETHCHKQIETCRLCAHRLQQAIELYRGDFLSGTFVSGSATFEHWLALNRERLQQLALEGLNHLARFHARRQEFTQARRFAQRQVELAPWLEIAYRQLMALSALMGQRGAALAQFETCRQRLAVELDVPPGPETMALYEQIKAGRHPLTTASLPIISPPPRQIPAQTTTFLGRKQEQLAIADCLQNPDCRMLTLVGPGGSGKTRLAIQAAADEVTNFEHGVFFVPLAALESAHNLPLAVAEGLNLALIGNKPPQTQLLDYMREKEMLLVLDNFEGLMGDGRQTTAPDFLTNILQNAPRVALLITSRQPVGLQAERLFDLEGLSYPDADVQTDFERCDAIQLFLERACWVQPNFKAESEETLTAIAAICRLAEGLPLGIELAAAWVREMTSHEILEGMIQSLDTLATSRRDVPPRHRSLRATFAYSWDMLSLDEQCAFCDLSVFRGGFVAEAAMADKQTLSALVEKSLLRRGADGRYQIHELLRQFGDEKLRQDPAAELAARDHHCAWTASFLQEWEPHLKGGRQLAALTQIGSEIENVRAGWHWAVAQKKEKEIVQSAPAVTLFYDTRGWFQEGWEMFNQAAAAMPDSGVLYGRLRAYQAAFAYRIGDYEQAHDLFQQSLALFRRLKAIPETTYALNGLAAIATFRGQYAEVKQHAAESLTIAQKTGDYYEEARSLDILGIVARYEGHMQDAKTYLQASLKIHERLGNQFGLARSYNHLGNAAVSEGAYEEALTMFSNAREISRAINYRFLMAYLLNNLGNVAVHLQKHQEASSYFQEALTHFKELGDQFGVGLAQNNLGHIGLLTGDDEEAEKLFRAAIQAGLSMQSLALVLDALVGIAALRSREGQKIEALALATLILHHPATRSETKEKAEPLSAELTETLPAEQAAAARSQGETLSFTEVTAAILS